MGYEARPGERAPGAEDFHYDVVIVGLGPTGATAANLLGSRGIRTLVVERDAALHTRQRAIAIDEDALRVWQGVGLLEPVMADMSTSVTIHLHNRNRIFLSCDLDGSGRQGLPGMGFFHQPLMERTLRDGLRRYAGLVELRVGQELVSLDQDEAGVTMGLRRTGEPPAATRFVRARYLIGCDGGASSTRKLLGIPLSGRSIDEPWLDIQARARFPHDASGRLDFNFIADPERPGADCYASNGYHRWEFRLRRDEDPDAANTPEGLRRLLAIRGIDADEIDILASWIYVFHARQADRWKQGRAFLCGDAAHMMPPFIGQGISSGVRDAGNLCWKLAAVVQGSAPPSLLDSYESERRPNVMALTRLSLRVGALVMVQNRLLATGRDLACRVAVRLPWLGGYIGRFGMKPDWVSGPGMLAVARSFRSPAGRLVWQPWVIPAAGYRRRLDDVLGTGWTYLSWRRPNMPAHLAELGVRELVVHERRRSWHGLRENEIVDIDDRLRLQFKRHRARGMLVRPDRFIYGSDRDDLALHGFTSLSMTGASERRPCWRTPAGPGCPASASRSWGSSRSPGQAAGRSRDPA